MANLFLFSGVVFLLYGIAGAVMRFFKLVPNAFSTMEFQRVFYSRGLFDWGKYPEAFGGLGAGSWWKLLLAGIFLILAGRTIGKYRKRLKQLRGYRLTGGSRRCYIALLILYPVISVLLIAPIHLKLLHQLDRPFSYIASFGILHIPGGRNSLYYNVVSILVLNALFSIYFTRLWGGIMKLPAAARRLPGPVSFLLCAAMAQLSVLALYPAFSFALPIALIVGILSLWGGDGQETEEERRKRLLDGACAHVQTVGSTIGLSSEEIGLLKQGVRSGEVFSQEAAMRDAMENSSLSPTASDEILYPELRR